MQQADHHRQDLPENEMDEMLRRFFQAEISPDLPPLPSAATHETKPSWYRRVAWDKYALLVAMAAVVLVTFAQFGPRMNVAEKAAPPAKFTENIALSPPVKGNSSEDSPNIFASQEEPNYFMFERDVPIDYSIYKTASGEVEQRTELSWSISGAIDPATGERIEVAIPTIIISIARAPRK